MRSGRHVGEFGDSCGAGRILPMCMLIFDRGIVLPGEIEISCEAGIRMKSQTLIGHESAVSLGSYQRTHGAAAMKRTDHSSSLPGQWNSR